MKNLLVSFIVCIFASQLPAQEFTPVDIRSEVKFSIKNFGITVNGSFKGLRGKIIFDAASLSTSSFSASIDAATINTGNDSRDKHLKKEDYFDPVKYPLISFVSTKIANAEQAGTYLIEGRVTIKGISKPVSFPFTAIQRGNDYLFTGQFKLNRRDFNVGGNSMVMADNLTVNLSVLAKRSP